MDTVDLKSMKKLLDFLDLIHLNSEDDTCVVTVECNYCSSGDYIFGVKTHPSATEWFPKLLEHVLACHPESVTDLLGKT